MLFVVALVALAVLGLCVLGACWIFSESLHHHPLEGWRDRHWEKGKVVPERCGPKNFFFSLK
jgi:hypothetical protein